MSLLQVGFLYLRYVGDPKDLVAWFEPYFEDSEVCLEPNSWLIMVADYLSLYECRAHSLCACEHAEDPATVMSLFTEDLSQSSATNIQSDDSSHVHELE